MALRFSTLLAYCVAAWVCTSAQASSDPPGIRDRSELEALQLRLDRHDKSIGPTTRAFLKGLEQFELGNYAEAVESFSVLINAVPDAALAYVLRGDAYLWWRKPHEAIADYDQAQRLGERRPETMIRLHVHRARARIGMQDHAGAIIDLDAALRIDPESADALRWRAVAHESLGRFQAALADYDAFFRIAEVSGSTAAFLRVARANVLLRLRESARAIDDLKEALSIEPQHLGYLKNLGYAYEKQGLWEEALATYRKIAELHPNDEWTQRQLARIGRQSR
jgi:tetratricopeptide (TPR) repeat protein